MGDDDMNFDTYKIKDELLEIYSDSEENFSVGKMLSKSNDSVLFRSYDEQGKNDGLHFVKSSYISEVKSNTQYLRKIAIIFRILGKNGRWRFN